MKKVFYILLLFSNTNVYSQITSSVNANFGVDADLQANYFDTNSLVGNDDWFSNSTDIGIGVIDTTGAFAINAKYTADPSFRYSSFYKSMSVPPFSTVNNKLLLGAGFVRDYHGTDSTSFSGSKNGASPGVWYSPPTQPVPNKNDILDVMMHMRRDGSSLSDSLWMFGGVSIYGTSGDRYFDFEMYQTDLSFDYPSGTFSGYGPDAGHTTWTFDGSGNVLTTGDIIFSADYSSSTLTSIEARIWINKNSMSITPAGFNWSGSFDGASNGAQYGYAGITPKTAGNFYTGLENSASTWAGAFSSVLVDNSVVTDYSAGQFMEFSVNLTKLGLDPNTMIGKSSCDMPFRRFMVKSRSSMSFTSQLKDFVGPIDFFQSETGKAASVESLYCGYTGPATLFVSDAVSSSVYTWSTTDGHIATNPVNDSITVDAAGTYVVSQQLQPLCPVYATDTVVVAPFNSDCSILKNSNIDLKGLTVDDHNLLTWATGNNDEIRYFEIEKSTDGNNFFTAGTVNSVSSDRPSANYQFTDKNSSGSNPVYYRLKIFTKDNQIVYSKVIRLSAGKTANCRVTIFPNPFTDKLQVAIYTPYTQNIKLSVFDEAGKLMKKLNTIAETGNSKITISDSSTWPTGSYFVKIMIGDKLILSKTILKK
jgi:hypothetical protein